MGSFGGFMIGRASGWDLQSEAQLLTAVCRELSTTIDREVDIGRTAGNG